MSASPESEGQRGFIEKFRNFLSQQAEFRNERGEVDNEAIQAALDMAIEEMSSPEFASWLQPLMGPTTAVAAAIRGENPLEAARDQGFTQEIVGYDQDGNPIHGVQWNRPDVSTELIDRGVNPVLAMAIDLLLVPDPTGVGRAADLIPLLSFLGPVGLRMLAQKGSQVQFVPAGVLASAPGNPPRRTPAEMTQFRKSIQFDPGGLQQAIDVTYDPNTMRWYVAEGNHRVIAALEADAPVPVTVWRGSVPAHRGSPIPESGQQALRELAEARHGYSPGTATPGQIGLPTYDEESLLQWIVRHQEQILNPLTDDEIAEVADLLVRTAREAHQQVSPQVGTVLARSAESVEDFTPTIEQAARARRGRMLMEGNPAADTLPTEARAYTRHIVDEYGWDEGLRVLGEETGLSHEEIMMMHQRWAGTEQGVDRAMYEGGVLARDPGMPTEPAYPRGEDPRVTPAQDATFHQLADEGAGIAAARRAEAAGGQQAGLPDPRYAHVEGVFGSPEFDARLSNVTREIDALDSFKGASVDGVNDLARQLSELNEAVIGYQWGWHTEAELARANEARQAIQAQRARLWQAANDRFSPEALRGVDPSLRPTAPDPGRTFSTGNPEWDTQLGGIDQRMQRVNRAIDSNNITPEVAQEANALFSEMHDFVVGVQGMDEAAWAARNQDLDEALWMINEFLENIRKNIDPTGGLL
jgi:hypothetical protein